MTELFNDKIERGAEFSECGLHRLQLWRIWDKSKPLVMFIGLNPSQAGYVDDDPTIQSVIRISRYNGYGGVYMMNCFTFIATKPELLVFDPAFTDLNTKNIIEVGNKCSTVVFAWGSFDVVKKKGRDKQLCALFPEAMALKINKNGSPKHPLYCKMVTEFINYHQSPINS